MFDKVALPCRAHAAINGSGCLRQEVTCKLHVIGYGKPHYNVCCFVIKLPCPFVTFTYLDDNEFVVIQQTRALHRS